MSTKAVHPLPDGFSTDPHTTFGSYFPLHPPARSAVRGALTVPRAVVEIEFLVHQPG
nr:hypothetical protein [Leisingera sp.]